MFKLFRPPSQSTIPFLTLSSFLFWFLFIRGLTHYLPNFFLFETGNTHVHHFAYGIVLLSILAYIFLAFPLSRPARMRGAGWLGLALSMAYDEFAMWLTLEDIYYDHRNFDALLIITLLLLNLIYFPGFWAKWGKRLGKLLNIMLLGIPKKIFSISSE